MDIVLSQPKMVPLPRNNNQTYRLSSRPQMWPSGLTLAMALTLNFQGQIWKLLYLSQKWFDCYITKSKHVDWTLGLKCHQWVSHRPWSWPWIFKVTSDLELWPHTWPWTWISMVKFCNNSISGIGGLIKIEQKGWELVIYDHCCDLLVTNVKCKDLLDSDRGDFRCQRLVLDISW